VADWRRYARGRAELRAGAVLLAVGILGTLALVWWDRTTATPPATGTVFTTHGYAFGVITVMLVGVITLGAALLTLGALLRVIQKMTGRD